MEKQMPASKYDELMYAISQQDIESVRRLLSDSTIDLNPIQEIKNPIRLSKNPLLLSTSCAPEEGLEIREQIALMIINDPRTRLDVHDKNGNNVVHNAIRINCSENLLSTILDKAKAQPELNFEQLLNEARETTIEEKRIRETALYLACSRGHNQAIRLLLTFGAEINNTRSDGKTALIGAILARAEARNNARIQINRNEYNVSGPNCRLNESEQKEQIDLFEKNTLAKLNTTLEPLLETINILLANNAKIEIIAPDFFWNRRNGDASALEIAASRDDIEVVRLLLGSGANPLPAKKMLEARLTELHNSDIKELTQRIPITEQLLMILDNKEIPPCESNTQSPGSFRF